LVACLEIIRQCLTQADDLYDYVHANFLQEDIVKLHKIFEIPSLTRICMFGKSSVVQYV